MKKAALMLVLLAAVAGCSQTQQGAAVGGFGGAAIGTAVASPGNEVGGALVGGAIGAVTGGIVGSAMERRDAEAYRARYGRYPARDCIYRDRRGQEYVAAC